MDCLTVVGVVTLGLAIGLLVGWFINEDEPFTAKGLTTSISVLTGAGVLGIFKYVSPGGSTREFWFYPVGILIGLLVAPFFDVFYNALFHDEPSDGDVGILVRSAYATQRALIKLARRGAVKG